MCRGVEGFNLLFLDAIRLEKFYGFKVGNDEVFKVSHLQFADDTLIIGRKSWCNICTVR
jgi:hypothetical protein